MLASMLANLFTAITLLEIDPPHSFLISQFSSNFLYFKDSFPFPHEYIQANRDVCLLIIQYHIFQFDRISILGDALVYISLNIGNGFFF
jgi:hypothetical protein